MHVIFYIFNSACITKLLAKNLQFQLHRFYRLFSKSHYDTYWLKHCLTVETVITLFLWSVFLQFIYCSSPVHCKSFYIKIMFR